MPLVFLYKMKKTWEVCLMQFSFVSHGRCRWISEECCEHRATGTRSANNLHTSEVRPSHDGEWYRIDATFWEHQLEWERVASVSTGSHRYICEQEMPVLRMGNHQLRSVNYLISVSLKGASLPEPTLHRMSADFPYSMVMQTFVYSVIKTQMLTINDL